MKSDGKIKDKSFGWRLLEDLRDVDWWLRKERPDIALSLLAPHVGSNRDYSPPPSDAHQISDMIREGRTDDALHAIDQILHPKFPSEDDCRDHIGKKGFFNATRPASL